MSQVVFAARRPAELGRDSSRAIRRAVGSSLARRPSSAASRSASEAAPTRTSAASRREAHGRLGSVGRGRERRRPCLRRRPAQATVGVHQMRPLERAEPGGRRRAARRGATRPRRAPAWPPSRALSTRCSVATSSGRFAAGATRSARASARTARRGVASTTSSQAARQRSRSVLTRLVLEEPDGAAVEQLGERRRDRRSRCGARSRPGSAGSDRAARARAPAPARPPRPAGRRSRPRAGVANARARDDDEVAEHRAGAFHGAVDQGRDRGPHALGEERDQDALRRDRRRRDPGGWRRRRRRCPRRDSVGCSSRRVRAGR